MALQDSFGRSVAKTLVDRFRVTGLTYVRVDQPVYDPATGTATPTETTYTAAGAVYPSFSDQASGEANNAIEIRVEVCLSDIDDTVPTTRDRIEYLGRSWKVVQVDLKSGDELYSATLTARQN